MSDSGEKGAAPAWFTVAAVLASLFYLLGCWSYIDHVTTDPATLAVDQRAMWEAAPGWSNAANAIAVWVGLAGAVLLVMKRRISEPLLIAAFAAMVVQFGALLVVPELRELVSSDNLFLPALLLLIGYGIWHLAQLGRKNGWLR